MFDFPVGKMLIVFLILGAAIGIIGWELISYLLSNFQIQRVQ